MSFSRSAKLDLDFGDYYGPLHAKIRLKGDIEYDSEFCSIHPHETIRGETCSDGHSYDFCPHCVGFLVRRLIDRLNSPDACGEPFVMGGGTRGQIIMPRVTIPCDKILHGHDCRCHLGHECDQHCSDYHDAPRVDSEGKPIDPHALFQLAGEAPSTVMMGVFERLDRLERENQAMASMITNMLKSMPEEIAQTAAWGALREKIGIDDVSGGTEGI